MFEEVTQHIQQQSDSQKYLEKLRTENERLALKEKERQVPSYNQSCPFIGDIGVCSLI